MGYVWLVLAVLFGILEAVTAQVVSIWFVGGAVSALLGYVLGANAGIQIGIFVAVSALLLILTRPFVKKLTNKEKTTTNAETVIGKTAVVTRKTDDMGLFGEAKVGGSYWTICSGDGTQIEEGEKVQVEKIEGVKLIVRK